MATCLGSLQDALRSIDARSAELAALERDGDVRRYLKILDTYVCLTAHVARGNKTLRLHLEPVPGDRGVLEIRVTDPLIRVPDVEGKHVHQRDLGGIVSRIERGEVLPDPDPVFARKYSYVKLAKK